jgi:hypothetical protein
VWSLNGTAYSVTSMNPLGPCQPRTDLVGMGCTWFPPEPPARSAYLGAAAHRLHTTATNARKQLAAAGAYLPR